MRKKNFRKGLVISIIVLFIGIQTSYLPEVKSEGFFGNYHSFDEIEGYLEYLSIAYPDITDLTSLGTTYCYGKNIWCLEISNHPGIPEDEPGVFFNGLIHGSEWPSGEICLFIADKLTSEYSSDPSIKEIVDNNHIWIIPCINPDGFIYSKTHFPYTWRKNLKPYGGYTGVDLNRNFDGSCDGNILGAWGSTGESNGSHRPISKYYFGPYPFSEVESQAIRDLIINNNINAVINYHTPNETVARPYGYPDGETPDENFLESIGGNIANAIQKQNPEEGYYNNELGYEMQITTSNARDWAYGYTTYIEGRPIVSYTIEACLTVHPPLIPSVFLQLLEQNYNGARALLDRTQDIVNIIPFVLPPTIDTMRPSLFDVSYTVSWQENNPAANPIKFQLDELTDLDITTDIVTSSPIHWDFDGFTVTNQRSHSYTLSYKSRYASEDVSAMTSKYPVPVTNGMILSFYCWYNTVNNRDYAFVEVSTDGRKYEILDKFTGSSDGWEYCECDLSDYVGKSIFIRFRYTTSNIPFEGFYVDDIYPATYFDTITTLSNSIPNNYYEITGGRPVGDYYYRVKGYNNERYWGDFSTLEYKLVAYNIKG